MLSRLTKRVFILLLVAVLALLATLSAFAIAPEAISVTKTIIGGGGGSAEPGDVITYRIGIANSGPGVAPVLMTDTLPSGVSLAGRPQLTVVNSPVNSINRDVRGDVVGWRGDLGNGAGVHIDIPVVVDDCFDTMPKTITNTAIVTNPSGGGGMLSANAVLTVDCSNTVPLTDIVWSAVITNTSGAPVSRMAGNQIVGFGSWLRLRYENTSNRRVHLQGSLDDLVNPSSLDSIELNWTGCLSCTRGLGMSTLELRDQRTFDIVLEPHAGVEAGLLLVPAADAEDNDVIPIAVKLCKIDQMAIGCPVNPVPAQVQTQNIVLNVKRRDLGDAPDSSNHAGLNMLAYVGINGDFPTVFDPAAGFDQGPVHVHTGFFHLGMNVSSEREADAGPDQDLINNIDPVADSANQDAGDDGVRPNTWAFLNCQPAVVPVQVFIHPAAVTYFDTNGLSGYVNVWLDSNRDGSWNDTFPSCGTPAAEHIIVNHAIDVVALGAGIHTINIPTTVAVGWPAVAANQPAWTRVTLSERTVPLMINAGGVMVGDGRSNGTPYDTGETEDYQINVAAPVLQAQLNGSIWNGGGEGLAELFFRLRIRNRGSDVATGLTTDINLPGLTVTGVNVSNDNLNCMPDGTGVSCTAANLPAGKTATVSIRATAPNGATYTGEATVDASNAAAVMTTDSVDVGGAAILILNPAPNAIMGEADNQVIEVQVTPAGARNAALPINLYLDDVLIHTGMANPSGYMIYTLPDVVAAGRHRVRAAFAGGSAETQFRVDPAQLLHPSSLKATAIISGAENAQMRPRFTGVITGGAEFVMPLAYDQQYRLEIHAPVGASIDLGLEDEASCDTPTCAMLDGDGDGIYTALIEMSGLVRRDRRVLFPVALTRPNGETTTSYGQIEWDFDTVPVIDAVTGLPVSGGTVSLASGPILDRQSVWLTIGLNDVVINHEEMWAVRRTIDAVGYQQRVDQFAVFESNDQPIKLTPIIGARMSSAEITIDSDGFAPGYLEVAPGSVVTFRNADSAEHGAHSAEWESGVLLSGASYEWQFDTLGTYTYVDPENPQNVGTIVVTATPTSVALTQQLSANNTQSVAVVLMLTLLVTTGAIIWKRNHITTVR